MTKEKIEEKEAARKLRLEGHSLEYIANLLKISKSTASLWLRDIPLTQEQRLAKINKNKKIFMCKKCKKECFYRNDDSNIGYHRSLCYDCKPKIEIMINNIKGDQKHCPRCKLWKGTTYFYKNSKGCLFTYCIKCQQITTMIQQREFKQACVNYKGNKCFKCKKTYPLPCYDFHHINPAEKDFTISSIKTKKLYDHIKKELDKCHLLCANCHRIEHEEILTKCKLSDHISLY